MPLDLNYKPSVPTTDQLTSIHFALERIDATTDPKSIACIGLLPEHFTDEDLEFASRVVGDTNLAEDTIEYPAAQVRYGVKPMGGVAVILAERRIQLEFWHDSPFEGAFLIGSRQVRRENRGGTGAITRLNVPLGAIASACVLGKT